jgi:hypothetical protein
MEPSHVLWIAIQLDGKRTVEAIRSIADKRLMFKEPVGAWTAMIDIVIDSTALTIPDSSVQEQQALRLRRVTSPRRTPSRSPSKPRPLPSRRTVRPSRPAPRPKRVTRPPRKR